MIMVPTGDLRNAAAWYGRAAATAYAAKRHADLAQQLKVAASAAKKAKVAASAAKKATKITMMSVIM